MITVEYRKISELRNWDKNPREIGKKEFASLKEKIKRWGQFKPVLITEDGEVIGGNMRLRAYKDLGIEDIWVSIMNPKTDAEKIEIAWSKTPHKQKIYRHNNTLFGGDSEARGKEHPTQKPTKLMAEIIQDISEDGDIVFDLFLGSGSTLIACEQTNRICYGMEIDPKYCDVIRKRYAKFTGKEEEWLTQTPRINS